MGDIEIPKPPKGLMILALVGPSFVWCAEYIGSGELVLATRTGAILGPGILWAVIAGIFLKYWIGMSGARYTVCTGEGMIDMFDRIPGPRHWSVWVILVVQAISAIIAIAALANVAGIFFASIFGADTRSVQILCGWAVSLTAAAIVWSGAFDVLKMVMSVLVLIVVIGTVYVAFRVFPGIGEFLRSVVPNVPAVPEWALAKGVDSNAWKEILPLIGWGAGGFASQVWYTYWVLGAGYGATKGRGYGMSADVEMLKNMNADIAHKIKGWCRVCYTDATIAVIIGIVVTGAFLIAGAGVLRPRELAPDGPGVAITLSQIFSANWGKVGAFLFLLAGAAALLSTQIGQLAGWPRLLTDCCRICLPSITRKYSWKTQYRFFLVVFFFTSMVIIYTLGYKPVYLVKVGSVLDGLLLTPLQAICVAIGLFYVLPRILSPEASRILKPNWIFLLGLITAFLVFAYFCIFQIPAVLFGG
ncbi:MAG: Nramp family divalent metal transporter [Planctomycetota bacterium]